SIAPRWPVDVVANPPSPAIASVLVTSTPMRPCRPVRGIVSPLSAAWFLMLSGVSPCAICHRRVPLFMSSAVMRPYGGLMSGKPCRGRWPPPPPPPRPPPPPAGIGEPASVICGAPPPLPPRPCPPPAAAPPAGADGVGGALGFLAVPCTQSKSDR